MKYYIEQDYTITGTKYFEIEAEDEDSAIEMIENGEVEPYKNKIWEIETSYENIELP